MKDRRPGRTAALLHRELRHGNARSQLVGILCKVRPPLTPVFTISLLAVIPIRHTLQGMPKEERIQFYGSSFSRSINNRTESKSSAIVR
jgi:hypothetical protein